MKFEARDEESDEVSLSLRSEGQQDKIKIMLMLAMLKKAAGTNDCSGSTKETLRWP